MPDSPPSRLPPKWLTSETGRAVVAAIGTVLISFVINNVTTLRGLDGAAASLMVAFGGFLLIYLILTGVLLRSRGLLTWAERTSEPTWVQRYVLFNRPGAGLAMFVSLIALIAAAVISTFERSELALLIAVLGVLLIVCSWLTMVVSFTLDYICRDARSDWQQLSFPGGPEGDEGRRVADYFYFSTAVSTTFGTTDVEVTDSRMRAAVTLHGIAAFVFNTVILAITIGVITG